MKLTMPQSGMDTILFQALRAVYQFERDKVSRFGLTYEGIYLLQYLRRFSPCRMGDIAAELQMPISTATRVVDRLQEKAFVSRCKDPYDRRSILLSLEPAGEEIVQKVEQHSYDILAENLTYFSEGILRLSLEQRCHLIDY